MIQYQYDPNSLFISEKQNGNDIEFTIRILDEQKHLQAIHDVRTYFENNNVLTDVLFYTHPHHEYQVIVRPDYYSYFLSCMFQHRLLQSLTWSEI